MSRFRRSPFYRVSTGCLAIAWLGLWIVTGCDSDLAFGPSNSSPTLGAVAIENEQGEGAVAIGDDSGSPVTVRVTPTFCCDPFERQLDIFLDGEPPFDTTQCEWQFADGQSSDDCSTTHVFSDKPPTHLIELTVRLATGEVYREEIRLAFDRDGETTLANLDTVSADSDDISPASHDSDGELPDDDRSTSGNSDEDGTDPSDPSAPGDNADPGVGDGPQDTILETFEIEIGPNREVLAGDVIILESAVTLVPASVSTKMLWRQVSGPNGELRMLPGGQAEFSVPEVDIGSQFELSVIVTALDQTAEDSVILTVVPPPDVAYADDPQWGGYRADDATQAVQAAVNSGMSTVIIPDVGSPWIVRPIDLPSNVHLVLEPGAVVQAKAGAYPGAQDAVLSVIDKDNVVIEAYGATIRMPREEYIPPFDYDDYVIGEWRHGVNIRGSRNVQVLGLTVDGTGGDAIYVAPIWQRPRTPCRNIIVKDCNMHRAYRNGMTVVSVDNLLIENCLITETGGTPPQASIDIEGEWTGDLLKNIVIRDTTFRDNEGSAVVVNLTELDVTSEPVSILVEDCYATNSRHPSLRFTQLGDSSPRGTVDFKRVEVERIIYSGLWGVWDPTAHTLLRFEDCIWRDVARNGTVSPFQLEVRQPRGDFGPGGIEFVNCSLVDDNDRDPFLVLNDDADQEFENIVGRIEVVNDLRAAEGMVIPQHCPDLAIDFVETGNGP